MSFLGQILSQESADQESIGYGSSNPGGQIETDILQVEADDAQTVVTLEEDAEQLERVGVASDVVSANIDVVEAVSDEATRQVTESVDNTLSEESFAILKVTLESISQSVYLGNVGFKDPSRSISVESFSGSTSTRLSATKVALEGISDTAKSIWDKFIAMLTKLWENIKKFFKLVFSAKERMKRRVRLAKDVVAASGDHEIDAEKFKSVESIIGKGGISEANGSASAVFTVLDGQIKHTTAAVVAYVMYAGEVIEAVGKDASPILAAQDKFYNLLNSNKQIIGGKVLTGQDNYNKAEGAKRNFSLLKFADPKDPKRTEIKGKVKIKDFGEALDGAFHFFEQIVKGLEDYSKGLKEFKDKISDALKSDTKEVSNAARASLSNLKWFAPSKLVSPTVRICNALSANILSNAPKEAKDKNAKEIKEQAKEGPVEVPAATETAAA